MLTTYQPQIEKKSKYNVAIVILLISLIGLGGLYYRSNPLPTQIGIYRAYRVWNRHYSNYRFNDWNQIRGNYFTVKYQDIDKDIAPFVLAQGEEVYEELITRYRVNNLSLPITIVLYPSAEEMNYRFGWEAHERALGAYHAGTIHILSPTAYHNNDNIDELEKLYREYGPFIHEFTHLLVDYRAQGNYPRWFTEGLAQYEEYRLVNLVWARRGENWYDLSEISDKNFDLIEDQSGIYWQSLVIVKDLIDTYGSENMDQLLSRLGAGQPFEEAFSQQYEIEFSRWEEQLQNRL